MQLLTRLTIGLLLAGCTPQAAPHTLVGIWQMDGQPQNVWTFTDAGAYHLVTGGQSGDGSYVLNAAANDIVITTSTGAAFDDSLTWINKDTIKTNSVNQGQPLSVLIWHRTTSDVSP